MMLGCSNFGSENLIKIPSGVDGVSFMVFLNEFLVHVGLKVEALFSCLAICDYYYIFRNVILVMHIEI